MEGEWYRRHYVWGNGKWKYGTRDETGESGKREQIPRGVKRE